MKNLLFKELKLCLTPQALIFCFLSALIIIPSWPSLIAFIYTFMAFFVIFPVAIGNRDMEFTAILPVRKVDIVKGKSLLAVFIEMLSIIVSIPFALLKVFLITPNMSSANTYSELGINFVLYGIVLVFLGLFNLVFISWYYKNPYKTAKTQLFSTLIILVLMMIVMVVFMIFPEASAFVNDYSDATHWVVQFASLGGGIILYIFFTWLGSYLGGKNLLKVDL